MRKKIAFMTYPLLIIFLFFKAKSDFYWNESLQAWADISCMILLSYMITKIVYDEIRNCS